MVWVFITIITGLLIVEYKIYKKWITPFSAITVPYLLLVPINNFWAVNRGFYTIEDNVLWMLLVGLTLFFCGTIIANNRKKIVRTKIVIQTESNEKAFDLYRFDWMLGYTIIVEIVALIRAVVIVSDKGISFLMENEGYFLSGIVAHMLLSLYPLIPIMVYYWLKNKKKIMYLLVSIGALCFFFLSFVKYHSICLVVLIYLFVCYKDRKYIKKATALIVAIPIVFFIGNYYISFLLRGVQNTVSNEFYIDHLWKYLGGSLIHDSVIFTTGVNVAWSGFYKLGRILFALPNMFLAGLFGLTPLFKSIPSDLDMELVGTMGEKGNTIDFIGYMFPSNFNFIDMGIFVLTMIFLGYFSSRLYNKAQDNLSNYSKLTAALVFMTFFCFFSFFGVYGGLSVPWEIFVWAYITPNVFYKKKRVKWK